ncbi:E3 ubiquitin-protein ligase TRIM7-like isoform X2 [Heliangelus exortis]|uniref:E3 ubiquitin-protein ligase TRIM7-like isoform X2 n=1 Tax=Heliangelus exortis TaxID=472823 RepID=UPI003A95CEA6
MGEEATKVSGGPAESCEVLAEFLEWKTSEEKRRLDYLEMSEAERRRIGAEFERLRRFLEEKEREVLGKLRDLDAAFEAAQEEKSWRVAEGIRRLQGLIRQLEAKDTGSILSSWSEMRLPLPCGLPDQLEKSLSSCRLQRAALQEALRGFTDTGREKAEPGAGDSPLTEEKAKVTPEPSAAPLPQPVADRKSVRWDEEGEEAGRGSPRGGVGRGCDNRDLLPAVRRDSAPETQIYGRASPAHHPTKAHTLP